MRDPRVYESATDAYTWQNNCLKNSETQVGGGCKYHANAGARQTYIHAEIMI